MFIIFLFAIFLRFYRLEELAIFNAEIAQDYLDIKNLIQNPLTFEGTRTSHSWLRLGSISYYLFFPILWLGKFHPLTGNYFWAIVSSGTVFLNFWVIKKIFDKKTAIISTILFSLSPSILTLGLLPRFYNLLIPLTFILLLLLYKISKKKARIWPIFLLIGIGLNLHAAFIILIPVVIAILWREKISPGRIELIKTTLAFLFPNIPFFLKDAGRNFYMTRSLIFWIPYKIVNFFRGVTLGVGGIEVEDRTLPDVFSFLKTSIFPPFFSNFWGLIIFLSLVFLLFPRTVRENKAVKILLTWFLIGISALVIHRNPPSHYFTPIFILPIILVSFFLSSLFRKKMGKGLGLLFMVFIIFINLKFLFSPQFFFRELKTNPPYIPYRVQEKIGITIIRDAKGQQFSLARLGPFDHYENEFKENYEYILWWLGEEPTRGARIRYIIVEEKEKIPKNPDLIELTDIEGIKILKEKK